MADKLPVSELLRLACIYAEQDRAGMLRALHDGDPEKNEVRAFLKQLRAYRLKRWGKTKLEHFIETATEKPVAEFTKRSAP